MARKMIHTPSKVQLKVEVEVEVEAKEGWEEVKQPVEFRLMTVVPPKHQNPRTKSNEIQRSFQSGCRWNFKPKHWMMWRRFHTVQLMWVFWISQQTTVSNARSLDFNPNWWCCVSFAFVMTWQRHTTQHIWNYVIKEIRSLVVCSLVLLMLMVTQMLVSTEGGTCPRAGTSLCKNCWSWTEWGKHKYGTL